MTKIENFKASLSVPAGGITVQADAYGVVVKQANGPIKQDMIQLGHGEAGDLCAALERAQWNEMAGLDLSAHVLATGGVVQVRADRRCVLVTQDNGRGVWDVVQVKPGDEVSALSDLIAQAAEAGRALAHRLAGAELEPVAG